jgi:uncharacterized LabA/DUF88 family protein
MKRYAFIDVHNTRSTATVLEFTIDPAKLFDYLKYQKWSCTDIFWYAGRIGTEKHEKERAKTEALGYKMRDKQTKFYKKQPLFITCPKCQHKHEYVHKKNKLPKANCDVELTVDCLELAGPETEFLIFTGDGDFKYLVDKLLEKKSNVTLFSTRKPDKWGDYRFSTRYDPLLKEGKIVFMEMDNLKYRLKKDVEDDAEESSIEEVDTL